MGTRSAFVAHTPVRIQLDGDERWIAIRPSLTVGQRNALLDTLVKIGAITSASNVSVDVMIGKYTTALVEAFVCDWFLPGEDGRPVPFDPALIADLDSSDALVVRMVDEVTNRDPLAMRRQPGATT